MCVMIATNRLRKKIMLIPAFSQRVINKESMVFTMIRLKKLRPNILETNKVPKNPQETTSRIVIALG